MNKLLVSLVLVALTQVNAEAQTGSPEAGKTLWEGPATQCRNCHGTHGEGAFGPDLAGRKLTVAQFTQAVRKPWGIMPAYIDSQLSDREIADFVAYFGSLPPVAQPGKWRFDVPAGAPLGQVVALSTIGCGQCHGVTLNGPRGDAGGVGADFEWFKSLVYDHTTTLPQLVTQLEEAQPIRVRMGNYSRSRLPESLLREVWTFATDLGLRALVAGRLSAGVPAGNGVTYTLDVENIGLRGKGLTAEDLTVTLILPAGASVVGTTGSGYQGVRRDEEAKAEVAVWRVPRLAPKDHQAYTITLSRAGTAADNLRGNVRWTKPSVKTGPNDQANIAPAPLMAQAR